MPRTSPALAALDRLSSQGRSLGIHILLAGQETAERHIGSRANFGAFALAGRLPVNKWKLTGAKGKPAISTRPGRFGYVVGDAVTVFQAAYPDLEARSERLLEYAYAGELAPLNVQELMMSTHDTHAFPSSEAYSSPGEGGITISGFLREIGQPVGGKRWFDNQKARAPERFPDAIDMQGQAMVYREEDLREYWSAWHVDDDPS